MPQPTPHISIIKPVKMARNRYPIPSHPVIATDITTKMIVGMESKRTGSKRIARLLTLKQSKSWLGKSTATEKIKTAVVSSISPIHTSNIPSRSFVKFLFIVLFLHKFRLCITKASGKAHTPMVARILRLPPGGSWRRRRLRENALHEGFHKPKVAQAPSVTLRVPPSSRRKAFLMLPL